MMLRAHFEGARLWLLVATPWYLVIDTKLRLAEHLHLSLISEFLRNRIAIGIIDTNPQTQQCHQAHVSRQSRLVGLEIGWLEFCWKE